MGKYRHNLKHWKQRHRTPEKTTEAGIMNRPYYDAIGLEPSYSNGDLLEQVYDDRELDETPEESLDWEILQPERWLE